MRSWRAFLPNPPVHVARTCTIPVGKALFFPVLNTIWFTYASDPAACAAAGYSSLEACALDYVGQGLAGGLTGAYAKGGL